jgi:branched-chain amino acid aminotransferase
MSNDFRILMASMPYVYFRGEVVPKEEAVISICSHSLQYGSTCFTGMRGYVRGDKVHLFRLKDHHERLQRSLRIMGWDCPISLQEFHDALSELVQKNQPEGDFYIRPFIVSESEVLQLDYLRLKFSLAIYMVPFGPLFEKTAGLRLKISPWRKIADEMMPVKAKAGGCYVNSSLAATDAKKSGYDDALLLDKEGYVVELTGANILLLYQGKIYTPPVGSSALDGITLRSAVEILKEEGYEVHYEPIDRSMVYAADELIVLGTAACIHFAASVDERVISRNEGSLCHLLRKNYERIINGLDPKSEEWITAIDLKERVC